MHISIAQMNPTVGDLDGNLTKILEACSYAIEDDADIVIFSNNALTGAPLCGLFESEAFVADAYQHLEALAKQTEIAVLLSCIVRTEHPKTKAPVIATELFVLDNGIVNSLGIPAFGEEGESFGVDFGCDGIGIALGEHFLSVPEEESDTVLVEMVCDEFPSAYALPAARGKLDRLKKLAQDAEKHVVYLNMAGAADGVVYGGGSVVLTPAGEVIGACGAHSQELITFDTKPLKEPEVLDEEELRADELELRWNACVAATRDYLNKNGFHEALVGLSGGIDSAVVAAIAADAIGGEHVHGVMMPSAYSSAGSIDDSKELAANLNIPLMEIPIDGPVETFHEILGEPCGGAVEGLAAENLQARIRTVYLMTLSNTYGWMLLNTGNKSEAAMGFSTLYGDTAGAFAPVGNFYKTQVYELARWRAQQGPSIPQNCITKEPSAELYPDAKDADRLPPYEELDKLLFAHIEQGKGAEKLISEGFDADLVKRVLPAVQRNEYKRRSEPLGPRLFGIALTEQRAWPVTNGWNDKC